MSRALHLMLAIWLAALPGMGADSAAQTLEYRVKAAFLLNFTKFTEWPEAEASKETPISICVVGGDPFGNTLDQIVEGEAADGRKIVVLRVPQAGKGICQMAYFNKVD